jgi:hypothetical protein
MDPRLRHLHTLDPFEAEQQLDSVDVRGAVETCWTMVPSTFCTFWLNETPWMTRPDRSTVTRWFVSNIPPPLLRETEIADRSGYGAWRARNVRRLARPASGTARGGGSKNTDRRRSADQHERPQTGYTRADGGAVLSADDRMHDSKAKPTITVLDSPSSMPDSKWGERRRSRHRRRCVPC